MATFANNSAYKNLIDNIMIWTRYENGMQGSMWMTKTAIGNRNGLRLRIYGTDASAEWFQFHSEELVINYLNGDRTIIDRGRKGRITGNAMYNRMKPGHPSGFIEAFSNIARQATALARENGLASPTADGILAVRGVVTTDDVAAACRVPLFHV